MLPRTKQKNKHYRIEAQRWVALHRDGTDLSDTDAVAAERIMARALEAAEQVVAATDDPDADDASLPFWRMVISQRNAASVYESNFDLADPDAEELTDYERAEITAELEQVKLIGGAI